MNVLEQVDAMYSRWEQETANRGRKEGEGAALLRLLERRFGALPEAVTTRVAEASTDEIEGWLDRVLDASSLEDVFAG